MAINLESCDLYGIRDLCQGFASPCFYRNEKRLCILKYRGLTLVELFVVLAIIATLVAISLPAIQVARERARETVCKNNVHQINLAIAQFAEVHKHLPLANAPGVTGGWMVEILPFLEQQNMRNVLSPGIPITDVSKDFFRPPSIFICPRRTAIEQTTEDAISPAHYVFVPVSRRESFKLFDAPIDYSEPWISGPEMSYDSVTRSEGPHSKGFFYANGFQQGVRFFLNGEDHH